MYTLIYKHLKNETNNYKKDFSSYDKMVKFINDFDVYVIKVETF